jgi:CRP-like cAMP-binding protein
VIESGTAEITRAREPVAKLGAGDFFGEVALIREERRRTATVTATSPMVLIVMTGASFRALDGSAPEIREQVDKGAHLPPARSLREC